MKRDPSRTLRRYEGVAWDQGPLFKKIYEEEYGQIGSEPYGVLIGDYYFDHSERSSAREALRLRLRTTNGVHGSRSSYAGSEVFRSLMDRNAAPVSPDLRQLAVNCLCTNRDLPLLMPIGGDASDFTLEIGAPVQAVRCLVSPTRPRSSAVHGNTAWQPISHLSLTYLSITDRDGAQGDGADALREMLRLYADQADPTMARQVDGIRSVASAPIVRRLPGGGQSAIARGLEVTVTFEEAAFEGTGVHPLGAVLSAFFARHVGINSFTETVARVLRQQRGADHRAGRCAAASATLMPDFGQTTVICSSLVTAVTAPALPWPAWTMTPRCTAPSPWT